MNKTWRQRLYCRRIRSHPPQRPTNSIIVEKAGHCCGSLSVFLHNNYDVLLWTWVPCASKPNKTELSEDLWSLERLLRVWLKDRPSFWVSWRFMVSQPGFGESFLGTSRKSTKNLVKRTPSPIVWISQRLMGDDGWHETERKSSILSFTEKVGKIYEVLSSRIFKTKHIQNYQTIADDWWSNEGWLMVRGW